MEGKRKRKRKRSEYVKGRVRIVIGTVYRRIEGWVLSYWYGEIK